MFCVCGILSSCTQAGTSVPDVQSWTPKNALIEVTAPTQNVALDIDVGTNRRDELTAITESLKYFRKQNADSTFIYGSEEFSTGKIIDSLNTLNGIVKSGTSEEIDRAIKSKFRFFESAEKPLVTGYYEAHLNASRTRHGKFQFPLYRRPKDLITANIKDFPTLAGIPGVPQTFAARLSSDTKLVPYFTREEIEEKGALSGRQLEIAWAEDPVALFFLHIQGSGVLHLDTGESLRVNYADKNGQPYRAIGQLLIQQAAIERTAVSMQTIQKYLADHPEKQTEVFRFNPSYVFFQEAKVGPLGNTGAVLTPFRSIATDAGLFPKGAPAILSTNFIRAHSGTTETLSQFSGLVMNQDTGGAIKGPGRVDLFTGEDSQTAGVLKNPGKLYFIVQRD